MNIDSYNAAFSFMKTYGIALRKSFVADVFVRDADGAVIYQEHNIDCDFSKGDFDNIVLNIMWLAGKKTLKKYNIYGMYYQYKDKTYFMFENEDLIIVNYDRKLYVKYNEKKE
jgi:hypothetical protein